MVSQHLALVAIVMAVGFLVGIYGHIVNSRALIVIGIVIIAVVSLLVLGSVESISSGN